MIGLQHFRYDNMSTDLMIHMGLLNVLINRLETSIKGVKETHNTDGSKSSVAARAREDDDIEMTFPKRVKMEFSPYIPVKTNKFCNRIHIDSIKCDFLSFVA